MSNPQKCPKCGRELPADAPAGLCPKCLVAAGLESEAGGRTGQPKSDPEAPTVDSPSPGSGFLPPTPARLADKFPQLEIVELLGHGGMGAVYKARQTNLDRLVALKIIRPEATHDPAFAERFNREAKTLARLGHQHIVAVHDFGEIAFAEVEDQPTRPLYYFLMEYVDGANLRQSMRGGELTPEQALAIVPQICDALQYAHDEGVVHRDIKPENILLDKRGRVKIADFGLAKLATRSEAEFTLTGTHQVMGTLRYMAPEQMEGSHGVDHRADIYSLGVVFYEMLTGEAPMGHFDPPSKKVQVDVRLDEVVLRSLAREPERRYQHASEVKTDVESISSSQQSPMSQHSPTLQRQHALPPGMGPRLLLVSGMMILGGLVIATGIALLALAFVRETPGAPAFWGWMGGAFGCLFGGLGALAGTWNSYRQLEGAPDLWDVPYWTILDRAILAYTAAGAVAMGSAWLLSSPLPWYPVRYNLTLIGGIVVFQGVLFTVIRGLLRKAAQQEVAAQGVTASPTPIEDGTASTRSAIGHFLSTSTGWIVLLCVFGAALGCLPWWHVTVKEGDSVHLLVQYGYLDWVGRFIIIALMGLALLLAIDGVNIAQLPIWRPIAVVAAASVLLFVLGLNAMGWRPGLIQITQAAGNGIADLPEDWAGLAADALADLCQFTPGIGFYSALTVSLVVFVLGFFQLRSLSNVVYQTDPVSSAKRRYQNSGHAKEVVEVAPPQRGDASEAEVVRDPDEQQREAELAEIAPDWLGYAFMGLFGVGWIFVGLLWNFRWPGLIAAIGVMAAITYYVVQLKLRYLPKLRQELERESRWLRGRAQFWALVCSVLGMLSVIWFQATLGDIASNLQMKGAQAGFGFSPLTAQQQQSAVKMANFDGLSGVKIYGGSFGHRMHVVLLLLAGFWAVSFLFFSVTTLIHTRRYGTKWKYCWWPGLSVLCWCLGMLMFVRAGHLFITGYGEGKMDDRVIRCAATWEDLEASLANWSKRNDYRENDFGNWSLTKGNTKGKEKVGGLRIRSIMPRSWFDRYQTTRRFTVDRPQPPFCLTFVTQNEPAKAYVRIQLPMYKKNSSEEAMWAELADDLEQTVINAGKTEGIQSDAPVDQTQGDTEQQEAENPSQPSGDSAESSDVADSEGVSPTRERQPK